MCISHVARVHDDIIVIAAITTMSSHTIPFGHSTTTTSYPHYSVESSFVAKTREKFIATAGMMSNTELGIGVSNGEIQVRQKNQ